MPQRTNLTRVDTKEVQGEGSFVEYRALKVKEVKELRERAQQDGFDPVAGGLEVLARHLVRWNWVGDDGQPLAQPPEDPSVIDDLTLDEAEYLSKLLLGESEELKN